jgi:copper(I)-binding protein
MRIAGVALAALVAAASVVLARQPAPAAVSGWVAMPASGANAAAAYVELSNPTMYDIYVTGAAADAAASVELRGPAAGDGEPPVVKEFTVPAFGSTAADKTGPSLRLVGLSRALAAGDTVQLTLTTDGGLTLKVAAAVRQP